MSSIIPLCYKATLFSITRAQRLFGLISTKTCPPNAEKKIMHIYHNKLKKGRSLSRFGFGSSVISVRMAARARTDIRTTLWF